MGAVQIPDHIKSIIDRQIAEGRVASEAAYLEEAVRRYAEDLRTDQGYAFLIVRYSDGALVGGLTLANIRRGVAQACSLGYWMGLPFVRQGYMAEAVRAVIPFAFSALRLHRLEAACIPTNAGSIRLLEKNGFVREGYAREYLCINGVWQDHLLFARLKDAPKS